MKFDIILSLCIANILLKYFYFTLKLVNILRKYFSEYFAQVFFAQVSMQYSLTPKSHCIASI